MVGKRVFGAVLLIAAIYSVVLREKFYFIEAKEEADYISDAKLWRSKPSAVKSRYGVVATDDGRCSVVGRFILEGGGHAVDAADAAAFCLGALSPTSSGIGGGGFILFNDSKSKEFTAFNMRETAPSASSRDMYASDPTAKSSGPMSVGVPGELAGLYSAWKKYGKKEWRELVEPAIKFARQGFEISPFTGHYLPHSNKSIMNDPGLSEVFVRNGKLLKAGDTCYNLELANTLEAIAELGPKALYDGPIGEKLVDELQRAGGILTMEDLRDYRAMVTEAVSTEAFGYEILGVPPPSSGALGMSMVLNVLDGYKNKDAALRDSMGLHRLAEAMKHMYAMRMDLGDPDFEDIHETVSKMLSASFAASIRESIHDNTTFKAEHYGARSSQLVDQGTSHIIVVDKDRNVVSMTTSLNHRFGGGMRSRSTGIILNNAMDDFSTPTDETTHDNLPPAETNFIEPNKRPLSSMTPTIVLKDNQFVGAIGCGGGPNIIASVIQIFINYYVLGMEPLPAVESPRIYHSRDLGTVSYENWTVCNGKHFELPEEKRQTLIRRGHKLKDEGGAICQLVVESVDDSGRRILTAVSDPRKGGWPEAASVGSHQTLNVIFYVFIFVLVAYKVLPGFRNFISWYFPSHMD